MQAGDIELNPSCYMCERTIMAKHKPMSCVTCGAAAHGSCTGLSRARRERDTPYTCHQCGGSPEDEKCRMCGRTFRMNVKRVRCNCGTEVHAGCSGMAREALRRKDAYVCLQCTGLQALEPEVGLTERERCLACSVALRRGAGFAVCMDCRRKAHKKCTGAQQGVTD